MTTRTAWRLKDGGSKIDHEMPNGHVYPIFWDDELALDELDEELEIGTFTKICPGLCIAGIKIAMQLVESYEESRGIEII